LSAFERRGPPPQDARIGVSHATVPAIFRCKKSASSMPIERSDIDLCIARVTLAPGLEILASNGEMLCEWMPLAQSAAGDEVMFSSYMAGAALYLPTSSQIPEGGYEVTGFQAAFGLDGTFDPDISHRVLTTITGLYNCAEQPRQQPDSLLRPRRTG